ncbi:MAG: glycoside hydrolase family 32 protein [Eubacteriales bacterium]|nr:glycoside hydrolase family 32 protein [Eubacteriales bacterium]
MDQYRPKLHFTPAYGWMNDPNGMVYRQGSYHLCYQYYPHSKDWGPMHWGHAVSADLLHWEALPPALEPCEQGMIFSGSATLNEKGDIVAVYTLHGDAERQGVAFSRDGIHFEPCAENPVIENPGIHDFRDPKFFRVPGESCVRLVLAAGDRAHFYCSQDYIHWQKTGEFGPEGNHLDGVWECPDLFQVRDEEGREHWVMLVSMTPNIIQYFVGDFADGAFRLTQRLDHAQLLNPGGDYYAAVTFDNVPAGRRVLMAWMNDWRYAGKIPTDPHRGAMALPRELGLKRINGAWVLTQAFAAELFEAAQEPEMLDEEQEVGQTFLVEAYAEGACCLTLRNEQGEELHFGVDDQNCLFVDRTKAGISDFFEGFAQRLSAPRLMEGSCKFSVVYDVAGIELAADDGTLNYSVQVFPRAPYTQLLCENAEGTVSQLN